MHRHRGDVMSKLPTLQEVKSSIANRNCLNENKLQEDYIKVYDKGTNEYNKLNIACDELNKIANEKYKGAFYFTIEETYFDYGQDWKWTTIIAHNTRKSGIMASWQALTPRDQEDILTDNYMQEVIDKVINKTAKLCNVEAEVKEESVQLTPEEQKAKEGIIKQLTDLDMTEKGAEDTVDTFVKAIYDRYSNLKTESVDEWKDKLSVDFMAKIFKQMKKDGWNGDINTADKYFDNIMDKVQNKQAEKDIELEAFPEGEVENLGYQNISDILNMNFNNGSIILYELGDTDIDIASILDKYGRKGVKRVMYVDPDTDARMCCYYIPHDNVENSITFNELKSKLSNKLTEANSDLKDETVTDTNVDNNASDNVDIENRDSEIFNNLKNEEEPDTIISLIEDRIGQHISVGEFNTILQSIFAKYNQTFLLTSDLYNQDPSESHEVVIDDEEDIYVISYKIVDLDEGIIEITDVNVE